MDNTEQNRLLTEAVERIAEAREQATEMMEQVFSPGMDVVFLKGRKKERKVGNVVSLDASRNWLFVKCGRGYEEVDVENVVEIVEPVVVRHPDFDDDEPEDASDGDSDTPF